MASGVGTYSVPASFSIQNLTESQATTFIKGLEKNDILYALHQRTTQESSTLHTPIEVVTWIAYTVFKNASPWSSKAKEIVNTGLASDDLTKNLNTFQNGTNLHVISQRKAVPQQVSESIARTLADIDGGVVEPRESLFINAMIADQLFELDLSNESTFTDLPSDISMVPFSKISLENNPLFRLADTIKTQARLTSLNAKNTQLSALPDLGALRALTELNISNNPKLDNIDKIKNIKNLEKLDISGTGLKALPDWLWKVQKPLFVTMSEDMQKLIPADKTLPNNLKLNFTEPMKTSGAGKTPGGATDPVVSPKELTKDAQSNVSTSGSADSEKPPIWWSILKWTGIGAVCVGIVGLAAWAWNKFRN